MKHLKKDKKDALAELNNNYLRALADYQNLEKRLYSEKKDVERNVSHRILERFLSVMDDIERAQTFHQDEGLAMIARQYKAALDDCGVHELDVVNKPFDPYTAEALEVVEGDKDDMVVEVIRKGYALGDDILRPAQVRVSKTKTTHSL